MSSPSHKPESSFVKREMLRYDDEEYALRKRLPRCLPKRKTDVYVNMRTNFVAQKKRCEKLLKSGETEVYIHGLGQAINRAVNIALQLKSEYEEALLISVNTSTIELVDDFEPQTDDGEYQSRSRNNSVVHIKLFRPQSFVEIASGSN